MIYVQWIYASGVCATRAFLLQVRCFWVWSVTLRNHNWPKNQQLLQCQNWRDSPLFCKYREICQWIWSSTSFWGCYFIQILWFIQRLSEKIILSFPKSITPWFLDDFDTNSSHTLLQAWRNWLEGTPLSITDTTMPAVNTAQVLRCINIGLLCVQENIAHRPIMSFVVLMLNSHTTTPLVPSRPAWLLDKDVNLDHSKAPISTINEVSISELDPR